MITITFEDHGQDFLEWDIECGLVVACRPFQGWMWIGAQVLNNTFQSGKLIRFRRASDEVAKEIRYPIKSIQVAETVCDTCQRWDSNLVEGMCIECRQHFHVANHQEEPCLN